MPARRGRVRARSGLAAGVGAFFGLCFSPVLFCFFSPASALFFLAQGLAQGGLAQGRHKGWGFGWVWIRRGFGVAVGVFLWWRPSNVCLFFSTGVRKQGSRKAHRREEAPSSLRAGRTWLVSGWDRSCQYPLSRESDDLSCLDIPACVHIRPSAHFLPHVPSLLLEPLELLSSPLESSAPEHRKSAPVGCLIVRVPAAAGVVGLRDLQAPGLNLGIGWLQLDPESVRARSPVDGVGHGASPRSAVPRRITGSACGRLIATSLRDHKPK